MARQKDDPTITGLSSSQRRKNFPALQGEVWGCRLLGKLMDTIDADQATLWRNVQNLFAALPHPHSHHRGPLVALLLCGVSPSGQKDLADGISPSTINSYMMIDTSTSDLLTARYAHGVKRDRTSEVLNVVEEDLKEMYNASRSGDRSGRYETDLAWSAVLVKYKEAHPTTGVGKLVFFRVQVHPLEPGKA